MIHRFKELGMNIVIDINSGAVHVVDDIVYDLLEFYDGKLSDEYKRLSGKYTEDELKEAIDEIDELIKNDMLFTDDPYGNVINKLEGPSMVKALCLNIAHDCNLRCKYCFASEGDYKGKRELMSFEVGKRAIDFVIEKSGVRRNIEVDLFGGEPLLNFPVVKDIIEYAKIKGKEKGKNIRFTITTNATLLTDEIIDYLDKNIGNIVLSIDGRPDVNDKIRVRCDGSGSFDSILPKIKKMVSVRDKDKQYYVRGTFTRENIDFYNDVIFLKNEGFKEISIEPVVMPEDSPISLREGDLEKIYKQYDMIAEDIVKSHKEGNGYKFYHFNIDINGGPCIYKRISGCGAGHEYIAVTPSGDIYPCHQFVGIKEYKMGNVFDGKLDGDIVNEFKKGNIYSKPECLKCWAKYHCSGGCQANNYNFNGDIHLPYELGCKMMKKRIECAIAVKIKMMEEN